MAVLTFLNLLKGDNFFFRTFYHLFGYFMGIGVYILPLAFIVAAILFFFKQKGSLKLQTFCIFASPFILGVIGHLVKDKTAYHMTTESIKALITNGRELLSGGLISGPVALLLKSFLPVWLGVVLMVIAFIAALMGIARITPAAIFRALQPRMIEEVDEEDMVNEPVRLPEIRKPKTAVRDTSRKQIDFDLDADDDIPVMATTLTEKKLAREARKPADVIREQENISAQKKTGAKSVIDNVPVTGMTHVDEVPEAEKIPEKAKKMTDEELQKSSQDVANEIAQQNKIEKPPYQYPPIELLKENKQIQKNFQKELEVNSARMMETLEDFGIGSHIVSITRGPSVTRYEIQINRGTKMSRLNNISDDLALSLGAKSVRIVPIPEKFAVGIEVPNQDVQMVAIRDVIDSIPFRTAKSKLSFAVGKDLTGSSVVGDITKMPHLLIAGTTGSGKSVCINSLLVSLLYKASPDEVKLIMVDPKMVELGNYNGIPHLLIPVVTDPRKAAGALNWAVSEMEKRYRLFAENAVKDLTGYNKAIKGTFEADGVTPKQALPQIVIVIDELADLMMIAAKDVESSIIRLAQKARAAGMHLIVATQRPSADVITGLMKSNIPSRIAFAVASQVESRIILDQTGAEKLLGKGDMLFAPLGMDKIRVQGCMITGDEIEDVIAFVKQSGQPDYSDEIMEHIERQTSGNNESGSSGGGDDDEVDELFYEAVGLVVETRQASTSMLQRRLKLGYSRAARVIDQMEERGIVGKYEGSKPREVLISKEDWQEMELRRNS